MSKGRPSASVAGKPIEIFVSYAHENAVWFKNLDPLLKIRPQPAKVAHVWHDQKLQAGDRWDKEIRAALKTMDIFVCLVSYEFTASDYIMNVEVPAAVAGAKTRGVEIVPILLFDMTLPDDCPELSAFQMVPAGRCWSEFNRNGGTYQDAHKLIRTGLRQAIEKVTTKRGLKSTA